MIRNMSGWSEFYVILMCFFNKYVHKLVTTDNAFIDARFNYETSMLEFAFILWRYTEREVSTKPLKPNDYSLDHKV